MSPFVRFIFLRLMLFPLTLFVVTVTLMAMLSLTPPEVRVLQYLPHRVLDNLNEMDNDQLHAATERYIEEYHTDDPFPMQYAYWVVNVFTQGGGISPNLKGEVFSALLSKTAVTAELTLYALLLFIPLGIVSGLRGGWEQGGLKDLRFRTAAYIATSLPPYIVALVLIDIFYMFLGWFPPGRLGIAISQEVLSPDFQKFTGLLTIDSLLNGRLDIFIDSVRHLVLPVCALSLMYWATLGRIVRSTIITERDKDYITAARSRGIPENRLLMAACITQCSGSGIIKQRTGRRFPLQRCLCD